MSPVQHIFNATHSTLAFLLFLGVLGGPLMVLEEPWRLPFLLGYLAVMGFLKLLTRMFYYRTYQEQPKYGRVVKFFMWVYGAMAVVAAINIFI